jgi:cell pole-organizing protein PopZ
MVGRMKGHADMGDMSAEPSMEEILSSIKRIIAEEGEGPIRNRRALRPSLPVDEPEVLELSDPLGDGDDEPVESWASDPLPIAAPSAIVSPAPAAIEPQPVAAMPIATPVPAPEPAPAPQEPPARMADPAPEPILSSRTAEASRSSLDTLSRLLVKPEPGSDGTLEGMVRDMLRPMLREWLDANLPSMVETMVAAEIARISDKSR